MSNTSQPLSQQQDHSTSFAITGLWLGLKTGFIACLLYLFGYILANIVYQIILGLQPNLAWVIGLGLFVALTLLIGGLFGIIPAMLIGMMTGWGVGLLTQRLSPHLSRRRAWLLGTATCGGIAIALNALLVPEFLQAADTAHNQAVLWYSLFVGLPSIIYVLLGGWLSVRLYATAVSEWTVHA